MLFDAVSFREFMLSSRNKAPKDALLSLVSFFEQRLGGLFVYPLSRAPEGRLDFLEPFQIADILKERGVLQDLHRSAWLVDEPRFQQWETTDDAGRIISTGVGLKDLDALYDALSKAFAQTLTTGATRLEQKSVYSDRPTTGLGTSQSADGAQLAAVLDLVANEAFMIMWLNQMSLPRLNLETFNNPST